MPASTTTASAVAARSLNPTGSRPEAPGNHAGEPAVRLRSHSSEDRAVTDGAADQNLRARRAQHEVGPPRLEHGDRDERDGVERVHGVLRDGGGVDRGGAERGGRGDDAHHLAERDRCLGTRMVVVSRSEVPAPVVAMCLPLACGLHHKT